MEVNKHRLRDDLKKNGSFGKVSTSEGHGRTVLTGSKADKEARENFISIIESLNMRTKIDPVGNIAGIWVPDTTDPDADPVTIGSHLDSVPNGGIFDGPLGVFAGIETIRAIQESSYSPTCPIQVVSFTEEEGGRFDTGLLGSSFASGRRNKNEVLSLQDNTGMTLREALHDIGFNGTDDLSPSKWKSWIELHIEQGTVLETAGVSTGIVTAITGITNCKIEIVGEANHAGGTLMHERNDALVAASEFVSQVERIATEISDNESEFAAATVGELDVEPNARNVIPGRVSLSVDVRDINRSVMNNIITRMKKSLSRIENKRGVNTSIMVYRSINPAPMSEKSRKRLNGVAKKSGIEVLNLPSGGGHDTMNINDHTEVGMLFARSKGGVSHSPDEWTSWDDCKKATKILANAVVEMSCEG